MTTSTGSSDGSSDGSSLPARIAAAILSASREGPPLVSCSVIAAPAGHAAQPGDKLLVFVDGGTLGALPVAASGDAALHDAVRRAALEAIPRHAVETVFFTPAGDRLTGRRAVAEAPEVVEVLMEVVEPAATLLVVGGGHVGRAIGEIGAILGHERRRPRRPRGLRQP